MRDEFVGVVESVTGRSVRAFMSTVQVDPEVAIEVFLFDPPENNASADGADASRDGRA